MILGIIINFSIMFTFIVFSYFLLEFLREKNDFLGDLKPFIIGMIATVISLLLIKTSYPLPTGLLADSRSIPILIAGLLGGPYALLLASTLIGLCRIFFFDFSAISLISGLNIILLGVILFFIAKKKKISFKNIHYFLLFQTVEISGALFYLSPSLESALNVIVIFVLMNFIGFYITFIVLKVFQRQFERIRAIQNLAETDYVTDLPNNRKFQNMLTNALTTEKAFSILLIDIDQFKNLNRQYGHSFGDEVLLEFAKCFKLFATENNALPARVSGDEFYLLCYDAPPAIGLNYATELAMSVRDHYFVLSTGEYVQITVSIGVSSYPDNGTTTLKLFTAAEKATIAARLKEKVKITHANLLKK